MKLKTVDERVLKVSKIAAGNLFNITGRKAVVKPNMRDTAPNYYACATVGGHYITVSHHMNEMNDDEITGVIIHEYKHLLGMRNHTQRFHDEVMKLAAEYKYVFGGRIVCDGKIF